MAQKRFPLLVAALLLAGCADRVEPTNDILEIESQPNQDSQPGGLFHDFIADGKYDAAGHPQGAEVFEGEERCQPSTGTVGDLGIAASAGQHSEGTLCGNSTRALGDGTFALNVRALMVPTDAKAGPVDPTEPILDIVVFDADEQIAVRSVTAADFGEPDIEQDLAVNFRHRGDSAVTFEVRWTGARSARLTYVEIFRATPRLVVTPASRVVDFQTVPTFDVEMQDPPDGLSFEVHCDEMNLTERLDGMLDSGAAEWQDTDFRTLLSVPSAELFDGCAPTSRVMVNAMVNGWARETSRVTYMADPLPCEYLNDGSGKTRVLLSGFEPFPADSTRDNSSKEAVEAYASGELPDDVALMRVVLPVEYDAAPALLAELVDRCQPDMVVGFGQGRSAVDVETIAYNRKDTASVAGGVPDNRGVVYGGDPIVEGGPAERQTGLPVDAVLGGLEALGINAGPSTDPGRYVCNNLFYTIMDVLEDRAGITGGFVHLPRIPSVDDESRERLRQTVATVVDAALDARKSAGSR